MPKDEIKELYTDISSRVSRTFLRHKLKESPELDAIHSTCINIDRKQVLNTELEQTRFVVLDTETTGFHAYSGDKIVSISLLEMQGLEETGKELDFMINPGIPIPQDSTEIHGIRDSDVKDSPALMEILPEVIEFIDHAVIIGHHIAFDLRFLNRALLKTAWCRLNNIALDTMVMYLGYSGRLGHYTLDQVAQACGVEIQHRHTAAGDTKATAEIFRVLAKKICPEGGTLKTLVHNHSDTQENF